MDYGYCTIIILCAAMLISQKAQNERCWTLSMVRSGEREGGDGVNFMAYHR